MSRFLEVVLDLVFPSFCVGCNAYLPHGRTLCDACFATIPVHHTLFCATCGAWLPSSARTCHRDALYLLGAASSYANPVVRTLIHRLKFDRNTHAAEPLAALMMRYVGTAHNFPTYDCVVPIPLGATRERIRGFNQSLAIAEKIASSLHVPLYKEVLMRVRDTTPQSNLTSRGERVENVKGCFRASFSAPGECKRIILIDDVTTSGATLREASQALRDAGATHVTALVAAKA